MNKLLNSGIDNWNRFFRLFHWKTNSFIFKHFSFRLLISFSWLFRKEFHSRAFFTCFIHSKVTIYVLFSYLQIFFKKIIFILIKLTLLYLRSFSFYGNKEVNNMEDFKDKNVFKIILNGRVLQHVNRKYSFHSFVLVFTYLLCYFDLTHWLLSQHLITELFNEFIHIHNKITLNEKP